MTTPLVAICMPIREQIAPETNQSMTDLITTLTSANMARETLRYLYMQVPGQDVHHARNNLTRDALERGADYLMWIDSDCVFSPAAFIELFKRAARYPIIGGLCFGRRAPFPPVLMRNHARNRALDTYPMGYVYDYPPAEAIEVDGVGGHFLMTQRRVYEQITVTHEQQWWTPICVPGAGTEDLSFSLRARRAGIPIKVHTGIRVGHVAGSGLVIDEAISKRLRTYRYNPWVPEGLPIEPITESSPAVATIVIPTYNTPEKFLQAAVRSALEQTVPCEIIVVDDGSTEVADVPGVKEGRVKMIRHSKNAGVAAALNTGFRAMTTDWFCWLSSDDLIAPEKVERQLGYLLAIGGKAGFHDYWTGTDNNTMFFVPGPKPWLDLAEQRRALAGGCAFTASTTMIHRSVMQDVGLFDEEYRYGQDWEYWNRVGKKYIWHRLDENLGWRRERNGNLTGLIARDPEKARIRDEEDARIRVLYGMPDYDAWVASRSSDTF